MLNPQLERINNRIDHLLDDLTVLKGLERSGSDVSAFIQTVSQELKALHDRRAGLRSQSTNGHAVTHGHAETHNGAKQI